LGGRDKPWRDTGRGRFERPLFFVKQKGGQPFKKKNGKKKKHLRRGKREKKDDSSSEEKEVFHEKKGKQKKGTSFFLYREKGGRISKKEKANLAKIEVGKKCKLYVPILARRDASVAEKGEGALQAKDQERPLLGRKGGFGEIDENPTGEQRENRAFLVVIRKKYINLRSRR